MEQTEKKRICFFLCAWFHDPMWKGPVGASVKIFDLAANLHMLGHKVVLFVPGCHVQTNSNGYCVHKIPVVNIPFLRIIFFNLILLGKILVVKERPDVIYMRRALAFAPFIGARLLSCAFFFEVNDDPYWDSACAQSLFSRFRHKVSVFLDNIHIRFADRVFVISNGLLSKIRKRFPGLGRHRFVVTPSGADTNRFFHVPRQEAIEKAGLDPGYRYIGFAGSLLPHQGIDTMIVAAKKILSVFPECRFLIIGEGPARQRWQSMAESYGVADFFIFTGEIPYERIQFWICASDICVAPYRHDAGLRSPVKVYDYMACGRPVVASYISGCTDIFTQTGAVVLVEPEDPDALADAVTALLSDPDKRKRMGIKARKWVVRHASRIQVAKKVLFEAANVLNTMNH